MDIKEINRHDFLRLTALCGAGLALAACTPGLPDFSSRQTDSLRSLTLLYTNDEHGWMEPAGQAGGAAGMLRRWQRDAGYAPGGPFLVLSGGDLWTGPALSTWFKGESMVDVMNAMGYAAAALGNHDFDFGVETLRQRSAQASFPLLSANIREKASGKTPDFARPYVVKEVNGIQVGLIGLTTLETPVDTQPSHVADLDFLSYEDALRETVPQVKALGAQLLVILGHLCTGEMRTLAPAAAELGIPILCAGHCHEETVEQVGSVTIVQSGSFLQKFIRVAVLFDTAEDSLVDIDARLVDNPNRRGDASLTGRVQSWHDRADPALWQAIGYVGQKISAGSPEMAKLLTTPWLQAYPAARIALFSPRYVQSLPAGDVSRASILSTLPTDNELVDMQLTGAQLIEILDARHPSVGGLSETDGVYTLSDGSPLDPQASYQVLIPNSLYEGGNYYNVRSYDPTAAYTGLDWRTPIVDWVIRLKTSRQAPLETYLGV